MTPTPRATLSVIDSSLQLTTLSFDGDEALLLLEIARRVARGRDVYGQLSVDSDPRDYRQERLEELLDAVVYGAAMELRKRG